MEHIAADVLLLSAGFGSRLGNLTTTVPKPLIPVAGRPVVEYSLELIQRSGLRQVFINLHYLGVKIREHIGTGAKWGLEVQYIEEENILGTGGAIKNIEKLLAHDVLLTLNSDVIVGPDFLLGDLFRAHHSNPLKPAATLVLRQDPESKKFGEIGIDSEGQVRTFLGQDYFGVPVARRLMYVGIQAISKRLLLDMPQAGTNFSITQDVYTALLAKKGCLLGYEYGGFWSDVGSLDRLTQASKDVSRLKLPPKGE